MCILKDYETKKFDKESDVQSYILERAGSDVWFSVPCSSCSVIAGPKKATKEEAAAWATAKKVKGEEDDTFSCLGDTGLFLKVNKGKNRGVYPLRRTSLNSLYARAQIGGLTIKNEEGTEGVENDKIRCLTTERKGKLLTEFLGLYDTNMKVLYRDGKISATLSEQYAVLTEEGLYNALKTTIADQYPDAALESGEVSHEFFELLYDLNDIDMMEDVKMRFDEAGSKVDSVKFYLRFFTSDIGQANAAVYPFMKIDGKSVRCGNAITLKHIGKNCVEDFGEAVKSLYSVFRSSVELLEGLSRITIMNPAGCLRAVAHNYKLPKKAAMKAAEQIEIDHPISCTAFDVFLYLNMISEIYEKENPDAGVVRTLNIQEGIAETARCKFTNFDKPFQWIRSE